MDEIHPNVLAYAALISWPLVALYLYRRLPLAQATLWTILGGYLLLPVSLDMKIPMIPAFNKHSIPNLAALLGCALYARQPLKFTFGFGLVEAFVLLIIFGPFVTSMLNGDPIRSGETVLPGIGAYDAGSTAIYEAIDLLSFFLARQFLRSAEDNTEILRVLVVAGLAYSLPMLFEIRMSSQLNNWIYGYAPVSLIAELRDGGFRPEVFIGLGLLRSLLFHDNGRGGGSLVADTHAASAAFRSLAVTAYLSFLWLCKAHGRPCVRRRGGTVGALGEPTHPASRGMYSGHHCVGLSTAARYGCCTDKRAPPNCQFGEQGPRRLVEHPLHSRGSTSGARLGTAVVWLGTIWPQPCLQWLARGRQQYHGRILDHRIRDRSAWSGFLPRSA